MKEQQVCLLHISICVFCVWRSEAAGVEVGLDIVTHSHPHWPLGSAELQLFASRLTCRILALGKHCVSLPFGDEQTPGYFYSQYLSLLSPMFQPLCCCLSSNLTSFRLACCSRFLTSLPIGLEASVSSADQAHLEL